MEAVGKIVAAAMVAACFCLVVRTQSGVMGLLVSLIGSLAIFLFSFHFLEPFLELFQTIRDLTGLADSVTAPMIRVAGIGLLTQLAGTVCEDAGEKTLSKTVEIGGKILSIYTALPVLRAVIQLLEQMLGAYE